MEQLPPLSGRGADLGCGLGILSHAALHSDAVTDMTLIDIDRRAIEMAYRNVGDERASFKWHDVRQPMPDLNELDFIIMNPPFHDTGVEDHGLGKAFVRAAANLLKKGGVAWIVANRHLPYEQDLNTQFKSFDQIHDASGFKIIKAIK
jgi:16S rRNA (guanine1207-N2)-methyltransferase